MSTERRLVRKQSFPLYISHCRGLNEFSFQTMFYEMSCVLLYTCIPKPWWGHIKHTTSFIKHCKKWKFISDSFYHTIIPKISKFYEIHVSVYFERIQYENWFTPWLRQMANERELPVPRIPCELLPVPPPAGIRVQDQWLVWVEHGIQEIPARLVISTFWVSIHYVTFED